MRGENISVKVYALCEEVGDYYTFESVFEIFTSREQAEWVMEGLIDKPRIQEPSGQSSSYAWTACELSIQEMTLR